MVETVTAGRGMVIEASKFLGDAEVRVTLTRGSSTTDLGTKDLNAGAATVFAVAPTRAGTYTVVVTGAQSGKIGHREGHVRS